MLTLDSIVNVNVTVNAATASSNAYDVGLIICPASESFTVAKRAVTYSSLAAVAEDWGATTDAYKAAAAYFGTAHKPQSLVIGVAGTGETVAAVLDAVREKTTDWYAVYWCGATAQTVLDVDAYLTGMKRGIYFGTITPAEDKTIDDMLEAAPYPALNDRVTKRVFLLYSATPLEAASVMGEAMGCANQYSGITWQLCYKVIAGLETQALSQVQVEKLEKANLNCYVTRGYSRRLLERGATISGLRVDEVIAVDRIAGDIQDVCLSLIADNPLKLPQTDASTARFVSAITQVLETFATIGYIQPGTWRGADIGSVTAGDTLESGYVIYADSFDNQSVTDRGLRKGMPIQVGICLCGSIESIVINVTVQE